MSQSRTSPLAWLKQKVRHPILLITTVSAVVFALASGVFIFYQMDRYEDGILDVCATQQDSYVQLVLDQINLKANRDDQEIIQDILGTLDASTNKYWTFSRDQNMLFVKDVLETNKYQGFTANSYYRSDSAQAFLDRLELNRVIHGEIEVDGKEYIASGVTFAYNGEQYRLVLLTNRGVLLDNNAFLGAKVDLLTAVVVILLLLVLVALLFARAYRKIQLAQDEREEALRELNLQLENLTDRLADQDLHDTRANLWKREAISGFLDKLEERRVHPICVVEMACWDQAARRDFLAQAHYTLDKSVLRFEYGENDLLLVFVQAGLREALASLQPLISDKVAVGRKLIAEEEGSFSADAVRRDFSIERPEEPGAEIPEDDTKEG